MRPGAYREPLSKGLAVLGDKKMAEQVARGDIKFAIAGLGCVVFYLNRKLCRLDRAAHLHGSDCVPKAPVYTDDNGKPVADQPFK